VLSLKSVRGGRQRLKGKVEGMIFLVLSNRSRSNWSGREMKVGHKGASIQLRERFLTHSGRASHKGERDAGLGAL